MTAVQNAAVTDEVDKNLAFLTYGLLFFSVFFAGVPALIAVAIAYARRKDTDTMVRGHHAFQIWIFWVGFMLALLAGAAGLSAIMITVGAAVHQASVANWHGWGSLELSQVVGPTTLSFAATFILLYVCASLWTLSASAYGFVRLASNRPMRQSRR
ncbi:hypothetical protein BH11PSE2_BH11PSE2_03990 [soil metagenome]